ncbi:MAG: lysophospholipid acyltransferase family protein [Candidatus Latescibacteria bacterium]|nr:lysophospholipid acyltransferase family protein [Candidatus Latescibacterota bacterium]
MRPETLQFLGKFAWFIASSIGKTLSIEKYGSDDEFYRDGGKPMIYAIWHGRMLIPLYCRRNRGVYIIVSQHRDGELVTATVHASGNSTVRGSSTRGGGRALVELIKLAKKGEKIAITPDGPKGPRWSMQPGIIYLAAKSGVPIVPITASARHAYYFKSWDSFQLPLPFSKTVLKIGKPYVVTGGLDEENIEFHRARLEEQLISLTREADTLAGASVDQ